MASDELHRVETSDHQQAPVAASLGDSISFQLQDEIEHVTGPACDGCRCCPCCLGCYLQSPKQVMINDWHNLPCDWLTDFYDVGTNKNLLILLAAGGASFAVHETLDDDVAEWTGRSENRWGKIQDVFGAIGNPGHHFIAIAGLYGYSLWNQDCEKYQLSKTLFNAVSITGVATVVLKASAGTGTVAPNGQGDLFGGAWPSGHTSSSFAFAAVLDQWYGPKVGIPVLMLAGIAAWERIDDREHDLSDVVFGAALGYVVGKTVARNRLCRMYGVETMPYLDPINESAGVAFWQCF
jgi:membrane-associated phospholipid phosphatase